MAFTSKVAQLRVTCISMSIEANRESKTEWEVGKVIYDAEKIYKWVISKEAECLTINLKK